MYKSEISDSKSGLNFEVKLVSYHSGVIKIGLWYSMKLFIESIFATVKWNCQENIFNCFSGWRTHSEYDNSETLPDSFNKIVTLISISV